MTILDTSVVIDRVRMRKPIYEDIAVVTFIEYPRIIYYKHLHGGVVLPIKYDYILAHRLQLQLLKLGKPQAFSDLLIASIAINRDEELVTYDRDFEHIRDTAKEIGYSMRLKITCPQR